MHDLNAMILAAGHGTRLGILGRQRPKPMLPVCNQPLVSWALGWVAHHGIAQAAVNLHHLGTQIRTWVEEGPHHGVNVVYSDESTLLGTGGGIKAMAELLPQRTTVVVNGKVVSDIDLSAVAAFHRRHRAVATMVLFAHPHADAWGSVRIDHRGRVVRLVDVDAEAVGPVSPGHLFTGIHLIEPELVRAIPEGPCCVVRTAYAKLLRAGAPVYGFVHRGYFYEHSTPERYLQGNLNLLEGQALPPGRPDPLWGISKQANVHAAATLVKPFLVAPDVRIEEGAVIGPRVVIGQGATVSGGVELADSVVWPQSTVGQSASGAIVTPEGYLRLSLDVDPMKVPR